MAALLSILLRFGFACLVSLLAGAQCSRSYIGFTSSGLGYDSFVDEHGEPAGFSVDFYRALEQRTGCHIIIEDVPPARLDTLNRNGRVALLAVAGDRHLQNRSFVPLISMSTDLLVRKETGITTLEQARADGKLVFGVVAGLTYGDWGNLFFEHLPPQRVDVSPDAETLYRKLEIGRVGATFGFSLMYERNLVQHKLKPVMLALPIPDAPRGIAGLVVSNDLVAPDDAHLLLGAAEALRADGSIARMLVRYVGVTTAKEIVWKAAKEGG
jgi:ABC-type amino acid transport substrate-binding protein